MTRLLVALCLLPAVLGCAPGELRSADPARARATVSVTGLELAVTSEQGGAAEYVVALSTEPEADVQITLSTSDPLEGLVVPANLTFSADDWRAARKFHVNGQDDAVADGDAEYTLMIDVASEDEGYEDAVVPDFLLTNIDDDSAGITLSSTSNLITHELGTVASFKVKLDSQPTEDVRVLLETSDDTEGILAVDELRFTSEDYGTAQTVTVIGVADLIGDGDVPYEISGTLHSGDPNYNDSGTLRVALTNQDFHLERLVGSDDGKGMDPALSSNGRFVVYRSGLDVFIADRTLETVELMSALPGFPEFSGDGSSYQPDVSGDGAYVVFASSSSNLVPRDLNGKTDIFLRDVAAATTTRLTLSPLGQEADASSSAPRISRDGRFVLFDSDALNLFEPVEGDDPILLYDRTVGAAVVVNEGDPMAFGDKNVGISADGRFIALASSHEYVEDDRNGSRDIYVRDLVTGEDDRINVSTDGEETTGYHELAALSADGSTVVFVSSGVNLVANKGGSNAVYVRDRTLRTTQHLDNGYVGGVAVSGDGRIVAYQRDEHAFVLNRDNGMILQADLGLGGAEADGTADDLALSDDGGTLAFTSVATNLAIDDTNEVQDVFVLRLGQGIWGPRP